MTRHIPTDKLFPEHVLEQLHDMRVEGFVFDTEARARVFDLLDNALAQIRLRDERIGRLEARHDALADVFRRHRMLYVCNDAGSAAISLPTYQTEMGDAGSDYIRSVAFEGNHRLPAQFRWHELWDRMCEQALAIPYKEPAPELKDLPRRRQDWSVPYSSVWAAYEKALEVGADRSALMVSASVFPDVMVVLSSLEGASDFPEFQHTRDMVNVLNGFSGRLGEVPVMTDAYRHEHERIDWVEEVPGIYVLLTGPVQKP